MEYREQYTHLPTDIIMAMVKARSWLSPPHRLLTQPDRRGETQP